MSEEFDRRRILVVDDEERMVRFIRMNLEHDGFQVAEAFNGKQAIQKLRDVTPDLILLDVMMPDLDGFEVLETIREGSNVPVIMLTAKGEEDDRVRGLELGADDYITKPFDLQELLARIHAVLRRSHPALERLLIGKLVIDFRSQKATSDSAPVHLTHREFELLRYLAERREKVVHREELLKEVWGYVDTNVTTRSVDHAIVRLRKKIEPDPHHPEFIRTVHGDGYCLSATRLEG